MTDAATLAAYAARADDYAALTDAHNSGDPNLAAFLSDLPPGGFVLDLGCGPGAAAAVMVRAGFRVDAVDASPEMVALANRRPGVVARLASFDDIDAEAAHDGVWANFSLLHAPKASLPGHLARIRAALKPGGMFHIALKLGTGEARDDLGRFYAYYTEDELAGLLSDAGFTVTSRAFGNDPGLSGRHEDWIAVRAHG